MAGNIARQENQPMIAVLSISTVHPDRFDYLYADFLRW
jgi:hypothetical protein